MKSYSQSLTYIKIKKNIFWRDTKKNSSFFVFFFFRVSPKYFEKKFIVGFGFCHLSFHLFTFKDFKRGF
jgi:hypothetical protein